MPCQECSPGRWECGPNMATLCELGGDPWTYLDPVCHWVCVRCVGEKDCKCEGKVDPDRAAAEASGADCYKFCITFKVRKDSAGNCVVGYDVAPG